MAELKEARVHKRKGKPTRGAVSEFSGEPVLVDGRDTPRLVRHSGLADTAHGADFSSRVPIQWLKVQPELTTYLLCRPVSGLDANGRWRGMQVMPLGAACRHGSLTQKSIRDEIFLTLRPAG